MQGTNNFKRIPDQRHRPFLACLCGEVDSAFIVRDVLYVDEPVPEIDRTPPKVAHLTATKPRSDREPSSIHEPCVPVNDVVIQNTVGFDNADEAVELVFMQERRHCTARRLAVQLSRWRRIVPHVTFGNGPSEKSAKVPNVAFATCTAEPVLSALRPRALCVEKLHYVPLFEHLHGHARRQRFLEHREDAFIAAQGLRAHSFARSKKASPGLFKRRSAALHLVLPRIEEAKRIFPFEINELTTC